MICHFRLLPKCKHGMSHFDTFQTEHSIRLFDQVYRGLSGLDSSSRLPPAALRSISCGIRPFPPLLPPSCPKSIGPLIDLLLLVDAELAGAAVDEQEEAPNYGKDLEEVVLGEVLVGMVLVELSTGVSQ